MLTVRQWTGREARALRLARRRTVRAFAEELGVAVRTVSKWEQYGADTQPRPDTQAILDTALARATAEEHERFHSLLAGDGVQYPGARSTSIPPPPLDYEQWSDDLDRAAVFISRQSFTLAATLIDRWQARCAAHTRLDEHGLYLFARAHVLRGDIQRDQGALLGPASAEHSYTRGLQVFRELDIPRRTAQVELSLAVIHEMSGSLQRSAREYKALAQDPRLDPRDQARARLWVGTALTKLDSYEPAVRVMADAARRFETLDEPEDWSITHQKLALAHRGAGRLDQALRLIEIALNSGVDDSPMKRVRLRTAHAHILVTDRATRESGLALLEDCQNLALHYGLSHQHRAIASIRERTA